MRVNRFYRISLGEFTIAYVPFAILVAAALIAPETTENLDRYRTIFTIWATILLVIPAFCLYIFSGTSHAAYNYWHLFWTFSYLAFLFHFFWAVFVIYKGIHGAFVGQGNLIAGTNFLLTAWWGADIVLSWVIASYQTSLKWERAAIHVFVFIVFTMTTLLLRPTPVTKALGFILAGAVAVSLASWLFVRDSKTPTAAGALGEDG